MELSLRCFMCFDNRTFFFPQGEFTYINGPNGAGKTTIFTAFMWVLYGKDSTSVVSWVPTGEPTSVSLRTESIYIYRQKDTPVFVRNSRGTFNGVIAQEEIYREYGTYDSMMCSCYSPQMKSHPLITSGPKERSKLLISLTSTRDVSEITKKLTLMQKQREMSVRELDARYSVMLTNYNRQYAGVEAEWIRSDSDVATMSQQLEAFRIQLLRLQSELDMSSQFETQNTLLTSLLVDSERKLSEYVTYSQAELTILRGRVERYRNYVTYSRMKKDLTDAIVSLESRLSSLQLTEPVKRYTDDDVSKVIMQDTMYKDGQALCLSLGVDYNSDSVREKVSLLETIINSQSDITLMRTHRSLVAEKIRLSNEMPLQPAREYNSLLTELGEVRTRITSECDALTKSRDKLSSDSWSQLKTTESEVLSSGETCKKAISSKWEAEMSKVTEEHSASLQRLRQSISTTESKLQTLERSRKVRRCPKCSHTLRIMDDDVVSSSESAFDVVEFQRLTDERLELLALVETTSQTHEKNVSTIIERHTLELQECDVSVRNKVSEMTAQHTTTLGEQVKLIDDKIMSLNATLASTSEKILGDIEVYKLITQVKNQIDVIDAQLMGMKCVNTECVELSPEELNKAILDVEALKRVTVVDTPPVPYSVVRKSKEWHIINDELTSIRERLNALVIVDCEGEVTVNIDDYASKVTMRLTLENEWSSTKQKLDMIPQCRSVFTIRNDIGTTTANMSYLSSTINRSIAASNARVAYEELMGVKLSLDRQQLESVKIRELRNDIDCSVSEALTRMALGINSFMTEITSLVFCDPIRIEITTTKTLKTSGIEKPSIGFSIRYKGAEVSDVQKLSGGESVRISTLLFLSFASLTGKKIMIFDEAASSLDSAREDAVLELVRLCLPKATILITRHGSHTGNYDNIIQLV